MAGHETRGSGTNTVVIADGGGPFQVYGPHPEEQDPEGQLEGTSENFSIGWTDKIERVKKMPIRQVKDTGKD